MRVPFMVKVWLVIAGVMLIAAAEAGYLGSDGERAAAWLDSALGWFWVFCVLVLAVTVVTESLAIISARLTKKGGKVRGVQS